MNAVIVKYDCAYLADVQNKCKLMIMQLQGLNVSVMKTWHVVRSLIAKLGPFYQHTSRRKFYQFMSLNKNAWNVTHD